MRWIKHLSNSQDDEVLSELITEFGAEGYGIWWIILEKIASQIEHKSSTSIRYSAKKWAGFCEVSPQRFRKAIDLLEKKMPSFVIEDDGRYININCPNILKFCDNWTQRKINKLPESLGSNSVATRKKLPIEVEVEVEVEEKQKKKKKGKKKKHVYTETFLTFWKAYPRKKNIATAEKAFLKLDPDEKLRDIILIGIEKAKKSPDWKKEDGQYIPYPSTWLNAGGWEDEIATPTNWADDYRKELANGN